MPALDSKLRSQLDTVCQKAREKAEEAARSALQKRAVDAAEPHAHFTPAEKALRNRLRARGRQAGDVRLANKTQGIEQLVQELAYEYWHRMLFARLLAENHLLMHPDGVAVSLEECEELAAALPSPGTPGEGGHHVPMVGVRVASNGFTLAARYASKMLPQVFRADDVLLEIEFAPEHRLALEKLLASLPRETFLADDSLGWIYQFWQSKRKDAVNKSGEKIDSRTLSAVTQLFTEDYMVQFLLHNTIGAWWVGQAFQPDGPSSQDVRLESLTYLRRHADGRPAAGTFDGWPKTLKEFKMIDPCCGSGHFLVAAFNLLVPLRMHDEGLTAREACDAVLRENLFGLELDPRCTQIAAFALAVAAWKYPDLPSPACCTQQDGRGAGGEGNLLPSPFGRGAGGEGDMLGYRELPPLNIACTGIGPQASEEEWLKLAEQSGKPMTVLSREPILNGLRNLHALFSDAPTLGSLIDPNQLSADLITADYETLQPYLAAALAAEQADDDAHERAVAAAGMVKAAELLASDYTLIITNVPYLARGKQSDSLKDFIRKNHDDARQDLATAFLDRSIGFAQRGGALGIVCPQNWLSLPAYTAMRRRILATRRLDVLTKLGPGAFGTISGEVVNVALLVITADDPPGGHVYGGVDVSDIGGVQQKGDGLVRCDWRTVTQEAALDGPDARITLEARGRVTTLGEYANSPQGIKTGDDGRFRRSWWELPAFNRRWRPFQGTPEADGLVGGMRYAIDWGKDGREFARLQGTAAWGKRGVVVKLMGDFTFSLYGGELFDSNVTAIVPNAENLLQPVWVFCLSPTFRQELSVLEDGIKVNNATVVKVPFDLAHWEEVAKEKYPGGLPEPETDDPTQWLFHGRPEESTAPLQVAVARLLGYRWPAELESPHPNPLPEGEGTGEMRLSPRARALVKRCDELLRFAAADGIVCIPAVRTKSPADERLSELVGQAFQPDVGRVGRQADLGRQAGKPDLHDWLRNAFFEQHCKLFHNRPFIWQIWDGRKDGFSCLLNYHKLDYKTLDNLTHSYLEAWIKRQAGDVKTGKAGAEGRLAAAQALQVKLRQILTGEPPYDIFVRWKPLHEQAIGWNPDLNDGVRMNIRPFVEAGILRKTPNIKWTKDRGKEPERDKDDFPWFWNGKTFTGDRVNDVHLTNAEKQAARPKHKEKSEASPDGAAGRPPVSRAAGTYTDWKNALQ